MPASKNLHTNGLCAACFGGIIVVGSHFALAQGSITAARVGRAFKV
jgi:hypothetical protein